MPSTCVTCAYDVMLCTVPSLFSFNQSVQYHTNDARTSMEGKRDRERDPYPS